MSEEKLYVVKNDDGKWADTKHIFGYGVWATPYKTECEKDVRLYGGHIVTLSEEPEKVVLNKEQAEIVERAHTRTFPALFIAENGKNETLLMKAYVNGYTVEKEKRYVLPIPGTYHLNNLMHENVQYYAVKGTGNWRPDVIALDTDDAVKNGYTVTQSDIDAAPDWVKAIKPVEINDEQ